MHPDLSLPLSSPPRIAAVDPRSTQGRVEVERFRITGVWCLNLYDGEGTLRMDGHEHRFARGWASVTPPEVEHEYRYRRPTIITWIHFVPASGSTAPMPLAQDLGADAARIRGDALTACRCAQASPARASAILWNLLWDLSERSRSRTSPIPSLVERARALIEPRLGEPLRAAALARDLAVSHTHLNRRFHIEAGCSIGAYIRSRRLERARHLLLHSSRSISAIAEEVGIPDLHLFNKTVRRMWDVSPRGLRARGR